MGFGVIGAIAAFVALLVWVWLWMRRGGTDASEVDRGAGTSGEAPPPRRPWTLALRVEGEEDEALARTLCSGGSEDVVLDLQRLTPTATHYYAGPAVAAFRCDLPGGLVVQVAIETAYVPVDGLAGVLSLLRALGEHPALTIHEAKLSPSGRFLFAVDESARPGHRLCAYCNQSYVETELECPSCGAGASITSSNPS